MKRSEMVKFIAKELCANRETCNPNVTFTDMGHADRLLGKLENAGMLPPLKVRCPVLHTDTHAWEDEDAN